MTATASTEKYRIPTPTDMFSHAGRGRHYQPNVGPVVGRPEHAPADQPGPYLRSPDSPVWRGVEWFSPERCDMIMETWNTRNRNLRPRQAEAFAADMADDDWWDTGDTEVKFGRVPADEPNAGELIVVDGQHTMDAIRRSRVGRYLGVAYEVPWGARAVIDTGSKRVLADTLRMDFGVEQPINVAALLRLAYSWRKGYRGGTLTRPNTEASRPALIRLFLSDRESFEYAVHRMLKVKETFPIRPGILALTIWVLLQIDEDFAEWFFDRLVDGADLPAESPILHLRNRATRRMPGVLPLRQEPPHVQAAHVFKAWRMVRTDQFVNKQFTYRAAGPAAEPFPEPE